MLLLNVQQRLGDLDLNINLNLAAKGVTAIFGRSGAGKSSLINLIAGLATAEQGQIILNDHVLFDRQRGINLPPEKRKIGYIFQEPRLFPHYRVEGNLKYGNKRVSAEKFLQMATLLGIEPLLNRFPLSLSGGEKQRVAIGRALLTEPDILLMDEPLSALDLPRKKELLDYLDQLASQLEIPILYVSHSLDEVLRLADSLLLLDKGKAVAFDKVSNVLHSPEFSAWQADLHKISLLELPIKSAEHKYQMQPLALGSQEIWINTPTPYPIGQRVRISIASQAVFLSIAAPTAHTIRNALYGKISKIEPHSDRLLILVEVENVHIWAEASQWAIDTLNLTQGKAVYLQLQATVL